MDWANLIKVIKIPLKVLIPGTWLFSGFFLFCCEKILSKLNLLEWSIKNGFIFGLLFIISSCLIIVYFIYWLINFIKVKTYKYRTICEIVELNEVEIGIIALLYKSNDYSYTQNFNEPIVQSLLQKGLIITGSTQRFTTSAFSNAIPIRVSLPDFVINTLNKYLPIMKKKILKYKQKIKTIKRDYKKEKIKNKIENGEWFYNLFQ